MSPGSGRGARRPKSAKPPTPSCVVCGKGIKTGLMLTDIGQSFHDRCYRRAHPPEPMIPCHICEPTQDVPRSQFAAHVREHALDDGEYISE